MPTRLLPLTWLFLLPLTASVAADAVIDGTTSPSKRVRLPVPIGGVVQQVLVREGQAVKLNDELLRLDDSVERTRLDALVERANVSIAVRARETDLELKRIRLDIKRQLADRRGATPLEVQEAETEVRLAEIAIEREQHEGRVATFEAAAQAKRVEQMLLRSPIDGIIESIDTSVGEYLDPTRPAMVIVQNHPLDVEIYRLRSAQVALLKPGQVLQVRYGPNDPWRDATVTFISPVVDRRSDTRVVKLSLDNSGPDARPAGLRVEVRLPAEVAAAGSGN